MGTTTIKQLEDRNENTEPGDGHIKWTSTAEHEQLVDLKRKPLPGAKD